MSGTTQDVPNELQMRPQVNASLRQEVFHYVTSGIRASTSNIILRGHLHSEDNDDHATTIFLEQRHAPHDRISRKLLWQEMWKICMHLDSTDSFGFCAPPRNVSSTANPNPGDSAADDPDPVMRVSSAPATITPEGSMREMEEESEDNLTSAPPPAPPQAEAVKEEELSKRPSLASIWNEISLEQSSAALSEQDAALPGTEAGEARAPSLTLPTESTVHARMARRDPLNATHSMPAPPPLRPLFSARPTLAERAYSSIPRLDDSPQLFHGEMLKFVSFRSVDFRRVRQCFGIDDEVYMQAFEKTAKERLTEGGASGAFFFFSGDERFMVKSCTRAEINTLCRITEKYADYVCQNKRTHLTRLYGAHCLNIYQRCFYFYVMENAFHAASEVIHDRFDIKGSWEDRFTKPPVPGRDLLCRFCNQHYTYALKKQSMTRRWSSRSWSFTSSDDLGSVPSVCRDQECPATVNGIHQPNVVRKDNELTFKLRLQPDEAESVVRQLQLDSRFLCSQGIMDYSLLLGVSNMEFDLRHLYDPDPRRQPFGTGNNYPPSRPRNSSLGDLVPRPSAPQEAVLEQRSSSGPMPSKEHADSLTDDTHCQGFYTSSVVGPGHFYIGVIDILQEWTIKKRLERFVKTVIFNRDPDGLSAIEPVRYQDRFQRKIADLVTTETAHLHHVAIVHEQS
ncbi:hypothetical protein CYMTET_20046 [Cymbomonas tetramitiformis]|uniref:1-phosphatidylinositol-4-phosphate 5-kinase n=1 Tax=Cymbomonas tetramitiformis TaxID=36881 RepID=A0AAE0L4K4_9CHLO|nr:hypothetical protein CYMTET_20046 [Cymbomonas tetramitiformis]